jgi:fumarylacetoacetase
MYETNETHDRGLTSWVESANDSQTDFPIQNLPFCRFRTLISGLGIGVGIGDQILDVSLCVKEGLLRTSIDHAVIHGNMNALMEISVTERAELRASISRLLSENNTALRDNPMARQRALLAQDSVEFVLPCTVGDYTDFYASVFHATNIGSMFRPDNPLLPNYKYIPIGYHGRGSSLIVSGHDVRRPVGQLPPAQDGGAPGFGPCKLLDYELEVGMYVGRGNRLGEPIPINEAEDHLFGLCLVNDWSARDLQRWEYQPLGPFLAKSFATTLSPWIVTMEALAPFRCPAFQRPSSDPQPLPYLLCDNTTHSGGVDLNLEVLLQSAKMKETGEGPIKMSSSNLRDLYWTPAQMLTHHSSNGCNMSAGDLFASGTVSGPTRSARGCLMELTWDGELDNPVPGTERTPIQLPTGEQRKFLADGDEVIFRGACSADGFRTIGFGECRGAVVPALEPAHQTT